MTGYIRNAQIYLMLLLPQYSNSTVAEAREWLGECSWADGDIDFTSISDARIMKGIARHFEGGIPEFLICITPIYITHKQ